jgi:hypothetical protein
MQADCWHDHCSIRCRVATRCPAKVEIGGELRQRTISEAAYQLYAERGYVDGLELDDCLQAEAEVDRSLGGQRATH